MFEFFYAVGSTLNGTFAHRQFKVNTLGVVHGVSAFLPLLRAGSTKKIIVIGSSGADLRCIRDGGVVDLVVYSMTKAAAHVAATKWALHLKDEGFIVVTLCPGMVDTTQTNVSGKSFMGFSLPNGPQGLTWRTCFRSSSPRGRNGCTIQEQRNGGQAANSARVCCCSAEGHR